MVVCRGAGIRYAEQIPCVPSFYYVERSLCSKFHCNWSKNMYSAHNVAHNVDFCGTEIIFVISYQMSAMTHRLCTSSFMQIDAKMRAVRAFFRFFQLWRWFPRAARTTLIFVIEYQMSAMAYSLCTPSFMAIGQKMRAEHAFLWFF